MVKILAAPVAALVAELSILNSIGASPCATKKVAALVARASCSGSSHSSAYYEYIYNIQISSSSSSSSSSSRRTDRWVHFQQNAGLRLFVHI